MTERAQVLNFLQSCAHFNDGLGLIISPNLAAKLKALRIDRPFTVNKPINSQEK